MSLLLPGAVQRKTLSWCIQQSWDVTRQRRRPDDHVDDAPGHRRTHLHDLIRDASAPNKLQQRASVVFDKQRLLVTVRALQNLPGLGCVHRREQSECPQPCFQLHRPAL